MYIKQYQSMTITGSNSTRVTETYKAFKKIFYRMKTDLMHRWMNPIKVSATV